MSLDRKAMLGHKLRRLRTELSLTQAEMAEQLGISTSYLNLIERNQRPLTVPLLLKLGQTYTIDLQAFAEDEEAELAVQLKTIFSDMLFEGVTAGEREFRAIATDAPNLARAILTLYRAYQLGEEERRAFAETMASRDTPMTATPNKAFPVEEVRDFFLDHDNHFPALEAAAEDFLQEVPLIPGDTFAQLKGHYQDTLGIRVRILPKSVLGTTLRRFDRHGRRVSLSEMLLNSGRCFQLGVQLGLMRFGDLLSDITTKANFTSDEARRLARSGLANYFAGALLMPYAHILKAAQETRYDLEILARRFDCSFEQVCHRVTTLQRPGAKGVPFFLIRADKAGNISKRFSAKGLNFARSGGACPRWVVYDAFRTPGVLHTQFGEMPDGTAFISVASTVTAPGGGHGQPPQQFAVAIGCEIRHAAQIVYADGIDLKNREIAMPIGINCRLCERLDCSQRAHPPLNYKLVVDDHVRGQSAFTFSRV